MKVLIIGGTGFISGHIAGAAEAAGHEVVLFNRGLRDPQTHFETLNGDAKDLAAFKKDLLDAKPDVVVHCLAYSEKHAQDLVSVFEGTKTHLVVLGSADCYEAFQKLNRGETADQPVRETSELSRAKHYLKAHGLPDYDKNLMTAVLLDAHAAGKIAPTVFRVPMVYGPGDHQYAHRHGDIIKHVIDGEKEIVMTTTVQNQLYTYGYVENVAGAIVHSFGLPQVVGQVYNLGEEQVRTQRSWAELYAENAGASFAFRIIPPEAAGVKPGEAPRAFIMDTAKFRDATGFTDPVDLKEAVRRTYDWAVQHPEVLKNVKTDYKAEREMADRYDAQIKNLLSKPAAAPKAPGK